MMPDVLVLERVSQDLNDDGDYFSPVSANVISGTDVAKEGVFSVDIPVKTATHDQVPAIMADTDLLPDSCVRTQCLDPVRIMTDQEVLAFSQTLQESILDEVRELAKELEAAQRLHAPDSPVVIPPPSVPSQSAAGMRGGAGLVPPGSPLSVELQGALGRLKHDLNALQSVSPLARSLLSGGKRAGVQPPPGLIVMRQLEVRMIIRMPMSKTWPIIFMLRHRVTTHIRAVSPIVVSPFAVLAARRLVWNSCPSGLGARAAHRRLPADSPSIGSHPRRLPPSRLPSSCLVHHH